MCRRAGCDSRMPPCAPEACACGHGGHGHCLVQPYCLWWRCFRPDFLEQHGGEPDWLKTLVGPEPVVMEVGLRCGDSTAPLRLGRALGSTLRPELAPTHHKTRFGSVLLRSGQCPAPPGQERLGCDMERECH